MTTKKRFSPVAFTAPTAEEPIPAAVTPLRPDAEPFKAHDVVTPQPREAEHDGRHDVVKLQSQSVKTSQAQGVMNSVASEVATPERLETMAARLRDAEASDIHKLLTSRGREVKKKEDRVAFTWRISLDQADLLDGWAMDFRRKLGRGRLDRSELLAAIVDEVSGRPDVLEAVASRLQST